MPNRYAGARYEDISHLPPSASWFSSMTADLELYFGLRPSMSPFCPCHSLLLQHWLSAYQISCRLALTPNSAFQPLLA